MHHYSSKNMEGSVDSYFASVGFWLLLHMMDGLFYFAFCPLFSVYYWWNTVDM